MDEASVKHCATMVSKAFPSGEGYELRSLPPAVDEVAVDEASVKHCATMVSKAFPSGEGYELRSLPLAVDEVAVDEASVKHCATREQYAASCRTVIDSSCA